MYPSHARRKILLDFDDVLFQYNRRMVGLFEAATGYKVDWDRIENWDYSPAIPRELFPKLLELRTPSIYDFNMLPMPGAIAGVRELAAQGHLLVCATCDDGPFAKAKDRLLRHHFPMVPYFIVIKEKDALRVDVRIDDGLHNNPDIIYPRPWNTDLTKRRPGQIRVAGWEDIPPMFSAC